MRTSSTERKSGLVCRGSRGLDGGVPQITRTRVAIIGAGPAGLLLARLLSGHGVESVIVENRSRAYVEARIRAGVLEQPTVDLLTDAGVAGRLHREGLRHDGIYLQWPGDRRHLDFRDLCGRSVWVYGQTEVVKDLIEARVADGQPLHFEASDVVVLDPEATAPAVRFTDAEGVEQELRCDVVAACDGFHGVGRPTIPAALRTSWERVYPYCWLGILADVPPSTDDLIYAWHPDGFAMHSMRGPTLSRLYLQVPEDAALEDWPDDRIWEALSTRLGLDGWTLQSGPVLDKLITPMRSFVSAPLRHGRLFLAGDAGHIVPPTGAKGLNLAVSDVRILSEAIIAFARDGSTHRLDAYTETALRRVWRSTHFSWWMTSMMHPGLGAHADPFERELQLSQLRYVTSSRAAAESLAENYTGLPFG
jgi:p-hydroxybenzoate 3-monooxygenase